MWSLVQRSFKRNSCHRVLIINKVLPVFSQAHASKHCLRLTLSHPLATCWTQRGITDGAHSHCLKNGIEEEVCAE